MSISPDWVMSPCCHIFAKSTLAAQGSNTCPDDQQQFLLSQCTDLKTVIERIKHFRQQQSSGGGGKKDPPPLTARVIEQAHERPIKGIITVRQGIVVSSDGFTFASWNALSGTKMPRSPLLEKGQEVVAMANLSDARWAWVSKQGDLTVVAASSGKKQYSIKCSSEEHRQKLGLEPGQEVGVGCILGGPLQNTAFTGIGRRVVQWHLGGRSGKVVNVYQSTTKQPVSHIGMVGGEGSQRLLATAGSTLSIWDIVGGALAPLKEVNIGVNILSLLPVAVEGEQECIVGCADGTIKVINLSAEVMDVKTRKHGESPVIALAHITQSVFASSSQGGTIKFWDIRQAIPIYTTPVSDVMGDFATTLTRIGPHTLAAGIWEGSQGSRIKLYDIRRFASS